MSEQVDTRALRAKAARRVKILLRAADPVASVEAHISRTLRDELVTIERDLSDAAPALLDELDDWRDSANAAANEPCGTDANHCTCVAVLRVELKRWVQDYGRACDDADALRARVAELQAEVERAQAVSDSMASKIREAAEVIHAHETESRELQAEVDACGEIIGQPPGASRGHAEIIAATIARHQEHGEQLAARVAELESTEEDLRGLTRNDIHSLRKVRDFMEDRDDLWPESMTIEEAVRDMDKRNGQLLESWNEYHETIWEVRSYFGVADDDNALLEGYIKAREWLARRAERVADLEREVERVRERDATAFLTGLRVIRSPWIQRGTIIVNDQEMSDAGFERAALAPRAEVKP